MSKRREVSTKELCQPVVATEFQFAVIFEGNNLKRFLVELCNDFAFEKSACRGAYSQRTS